ncbi:MAG: 2OG-Fe(II) oxygenase [Candidatus Dormibacteria bacterium]
MVADGLIEVDQSALAAFPDVTWEYWDELGDRYQSNKRACSRIEMIPAPFAELIRELCEPRALRALETITGIKRLLPDPYLVGGGLHLSGPGGILSPHTDFHHHRQLDLYRRINLLLYLNEEWSEADGGCLTLYDGSWAAKTIVPAWCRTVIFQTDDRSVHGFPIGVAAGRWRRSVALYYYTAAETRSFSGDATTFWREHGEQPGLTRRGRMLVYRGLLNLSRGISVLAHLVNPNQGLGLVRTVLANRKKARRR